MAAHRSRLIGAAGCNAWIADLRAVPNQTAEQLVNLKHEVQISTAVLGESVAVTGSVHGLCVVWGLDGTPTHSFLHSDWVTCVRILSDGTGPASSGNGVRSRNSVAASAGHVLVTGSLDQILRAWRAERNGSRAPGDTGGSEALRTPVGVPRIAAIALSHRGDMVLAGCEDGFGRLFKCDTGALVRKSPEHSGEVTTARASATRDAFMTSCRGEDKY